MSAAPDMIEKPPWVVDAQAFIDAEWQLHVHRTEHVQLPDWPIRSEQVFQLAKANGSPCIDYREIRVECVYCLEQGYNTDYSDDERNRA